MVIRDGVYLSSLFSIPWMSKSLHPTFDVVLRRFCYCGGVLQGVNFVVPVRTSSRLILTYSGRARLASSCSLLSKRVCCSCLATCRSEAHMTLLEHYLA